LTSGRPTLMPTARRLEDETCDPQIRLHNGATIPQLAFGLYMVPNDASGEAVVLDAIRAGYRHFDTATYYGNEAMLGRALQASNVPREAMYVSTKVWNDAVKNGRDAVRQSVLESLQHLQIEYVDLVLIHWPVPEHFVDAYKELEDLVEQGKIKSIGLSNFTPQEYQELVKSGITVHPVVNQIEVSPLMYRPKLVQYFQEHWIAVAASKSLNRAACLDHPAIVEIAKRHSVTPAQVVLRWSVQKGLVVVTKTSKPDRMKENRSVVHFSLSVEDMVLLDSLTPPEAIRERDELEAIRKASL
jgi:diketogulonate reductase-like aldo/keto reductase